MMNKKLTADEAKHARESVGASQTEIASAVGVNRTYYSLFESGRYVFDDAEHGRLFDALTERGYDTDTDTDTDIDIDDSAAVSQSAVRLADAPTEGTPGANLTPEQLAIARAKAALSTIRQSLPRGVQSIRVASAVKSASDVLGNLDYIDLLQLATDAGLDTAGLITVDEFSQLELTDMKAWESRAAGVLICSALYGTAWAGACFSQLKATESELRGALDGAVIHYRERGFLDILFGDGDEHCPNRRADLAPYLVQAAIQRKAPALASEEPTDLDPESESVGFRFFDSDTLDDKPAATKPTPSKTAVIKPLRTPATP